MKKIFCIFLFIIFDMICIFISNTTAVLFKNEINSALGIDIIHDIEQYNSFYIMYFVTICIFFYQGIYTKRYDFWHENLLIAKSCLLSFVIIFSFLALGKNLSYSRTIITISFSMICLFIPFAKYILKTNLFKLGLWSKKAKVINGSPKFIRELFRNNYLGYKITRKDDYETIFIFSKGLNISDLSKVVEENILANKEIIFTPTLIGYDFSKGNIFNIFNSRINLFMLKNSLLSPINRFIKICIDFFILMCAFPFLLLAFFIIFFLIKIEEPRGSIFFKQLRLGQKGKEFWCYKFRSMKENSGELMKEYLQKHPEEVQYHNTFHKYKNDPRITKIGSFLRKSSLDELPQLINVLKLEMSIVGPRPFITGEREQAGVSPNDMRILLSVKPGMTGLAQISGRGDTDFKIRTQMDIWYVKNWSIYNDIIIILKTIIAVLKREGAS